MPECENLHSENRQYFENHRRSIPLSVAMLKIFAIDRHGTRDKGVRYFREGSQISANQKGENFAFPLLIG